MFINWDGFKRMAQLQGWTSATSYFDLIGIDIQIDIWLRFSGLRNNQKITSRCIPISMPTTWVPDTNFSGSDSPARHGFKGLSAESIWRFLETSNHLNVSIFHGKIRYDKDSDAISFNFHFHGDSANPPKVISHSDPSTIDAKSTLMSDCWWIHRFPAGKGLPGERTWFLIG